MNIENDLHEYHFVGGCPEVELSDDQKKALIIIDLDEHINQYIAASFDREPESDPTLTRLDFTKRKLTEEFARRRATPVTINVTCYRLALISYLLPDTDA